jgi:CO/xanthine dehydrogenase FAD-binding subunit
VPFHAFYTGYRKSVMRPDELITSVEIPPVAGRPWYRKVGTRAAQAISKVVMAGVRAARARIALGSVAPTVVSLEAGSLEEAREAMARTIAPIDDLRSTAAYRRRVAGNLLDQFWRETDAHEAGAVRGDRRRRGRGRDVSGRG